MIINYIKIKYNNLYALFREIISSKNKDYEFIKQSYVLYGEYFNETLNFLLTLGIIKLEQEKIILNDSSFKDLKKKNIFKIFLIKKMLKNKDIKTDLKIYFSNFKPMINKQFSYQPSTKDNLRFLGIRNFLITLEIVENDLFDRRYLIKPHYNYFVEPLLNTNRLSLDALKLKNSENEKIGLLAEKEVIKYEMKKLIKYKDQYQKLINHVSISDVSLGYDILSHEISFKGDLSPIMIEVKAVSIEDYKFYWSSSEMEAAKRFNNKYYLYLVPCIGDNLFDLTKMRIINNPFHSLLNQNDWYQKIEAISFSSKKVLDP